MSKKDKALTNDEKKALRTQKKIDKKEEKYKDKNAAKEKKIKIVKLKKKQKSDISEKKQQIFEITKSLKTLSSKQEKLEAKKQVKALRKQLRFLKKDQRKELKKQKKEYKVLQKKARKPKGRIRYIPLIIVTVLLAGIYYFFTYKLDDILKNTIKNMAENAAEAKCDINIVDFSLIESYFLIEEFALANKENTMQNLFEFSRMSIDFDLTQLFLGRFVADEVSMEDFRINTPRTISGKLSDAKLEKIAKAKKEKEEKKSNSEFSKALTTIKNQADVKSKNYIQEIIKQYSAENILNSYIERLTLPTMIEGAQTSVEEVVQYWQNIIPELETTGASLSEDSKKLIEMINAPEANAEVIKAGIESSVEILKQSQTMYDQLDVLFKNIEKDSVMVQKLANNIATSMQVDAAFVSNEIDTIQSFDLSDAGGLITPIVENYIIGTLGDYYPMVLEAIAYLDDLKAKMDTSKKTEEESEGFKRLKGQTIVFNKAMPSVLIKKVLFSGSDASNWVTVDGFINDITHQPEIIEKPATGSLNVSIDRYDIAVDMLVDIREKTQNKLIEIDFVGDGLETAFLMNPKDVGIPSVDGIMGLNAALNVEKTGGFNLDAKLDFRDTLLTSAQFEPAEIHSIYSDILSTIDSFYLNTSIGFNLTHGINIKLDTDADRKILEGLEEALNEVLAEIKVSVQNEIKNHLESYTKQFNEEIEQFTKEKEDLANLRSKIGDIEKELEASRKKRQEELKKESEGTINQAIDDAKQKAENAKQEREEEFKEGIENTFGDLLGGFKRP